MGADVGQNYSPPLVDKQNSDFHINTDTPSLTTPKIYFVRAKILFCLTYTPYALL